MLLIFGYVLYSLYLAGRGWITGVFIPNQMFDAPFLFPWCFATLIIAYKIFVKDDRWGLIFLPLFFFLLIAFWYVKGIIPPTPNKLTLWAPAFFFTETFAHASFYCGAIFAAAGLIGTGEPDAFHNFVIWGFISYCVAQVTGAIWCYLGWGNTFQWVPKHMGSTAIWLVYAAYLHLRFIPGWNTSRRSWFAIAAAVISFLINASYYIKELSFPRIGG